MTYLHRFVPASRPGAPVILALHGTGGDENDLIPIARMIDPGAAILSPRGNVLEQGMPRFFRRIAEGVFDLEDLRKRTGELADFVAGAVKQYGVDRAPVVAVGYSNGANIAASLMLSNPGVLAGGVLMRPMIPFEPETLPSLGGTGVFISAGRQDPIVPRTQTERLADLLTMSGAEVTLSWLDTGHGLVREEIAAASRWFGTRFESHAAP